MFMLISAKLAKQADPKYNSYSGWLVFNPTMKLVYHFKLKIEAVKAYERLNKITQNNC